MRKITTVFVLVVLILGIANVASAEEHHVDARLQPVGGTGITGVVELTQRPGDDGTHITVVAQGLQPGNAYISLYYDNHVCALEPYEPDDVIGTYTANAGGVGKTKTNAEDNLDEINSVSVRDASSFDLLACADVHPGG
jgi:hypothetical protein